MMLLTEEGDSASSKPFLLTDISRKDDSATLLARKMQILLSILIGTDSRFIYLYKVFGTFQWHVLVSNNEKKKIWDTLWAILTPKISSAMSNQALLLGLTRRLLSCQLWITTWAIVVLQTATFAFVLFFLFLI